jgi:hypothetical protein
MEKEKQDSDEKSRQEEMCRILVNLFHKIKSNNEHLYRLRNEIERELEPWNRDHLETISLSELEDYFYEVGACVFGGAQAVDKLLENDWDEFIGSFKELGTKCDHTFKGSEKILRDIGYSDSEIEVIFEWFKEESAFCDCEVYWNIAMKPELLERT